MILNTDATDALAVNGAACVRWLLWAQPWRLVDDVQVSVGLWTGPGDLTITIDGDVRVYQGAQGAMAMHPITYEAGLVVKSQQVDFGLTPEAENLVRAHRTRQAPAEVHIAICDPSSESVLDTARVWRGQIDTAAISVGARDGGVTATVHIASGMRGLTDTHALKKTDASQQLRGGDLFRRYGAVSATIAPAEWASS